MKHPIAKNLWTLACVLPFLTGCWGEVPVKEKIVNVEVAKYQPTPARLTEATPHYALPDPACSFTAKDGTVSRVFCVSQITDALEGERAQVNACNIDKACVRALENGGKCD